MLRQINIFHVLLLAVSVASPSCGQKVLIWNKSPEKDLSFYRVYHNSIHLASTGIESLPISLLGRYNVTAVDTAGNESGLSESVYLTTVGASPPLRVRNLTVNSKGDTAVVSLGDSVVVAFELINRLEDGTVVPDSTIRYGVYFRHVGTTQWFQIGALQQTHQTSRQTVFLGLQPRDRIEIVVNTFYMGVQSIPAVQSVFVRILPQAIWKRRTIKIIV